MSETAVKVRQVVLFLAISAALVGALWVGVTISRWLGARPLRAFHLEVDSLFEAFHKYKEHVGQYPQGGNAEIAKALTGNNPKKVIILALKKESINDKGEIIDPWGTPLKIYFTENEILIRSAGPNRRYDDSRASRGDDLFRSD
jgi:hypothetical protein